MKVCLLSRSDGRGGAYAAAYRLHQGLKKLNVNSTMLVGDKTRDDVTVLSDSSKLGKGWVKISPTLDSFPLRSYPSREKSLFSVPKSGPSAPSPSYLSIPVVSLTSPHKIASVAG